MGCAPGKGEITGKVTYNGTPLKKPDGHIVFVSPDGVQVVAPIAEDGTYRATGVVKGQNKVAVYYSNPKFPTLATTSKKVPSAKESPTGTPLPPVDIPPYLTPAKYASEGTSGFAVSVGATTEFNADMTGPPIK
ncbi:MAG: hypothetical protein C0467_14155 [Planctomycetaceae bacterium]|nr:hypothetical protein [Planctomycetaceae bacterium]